MSAAKLMAPSMLSSALWWAARGMPVFPVFELKDGRCSCGPTEECTKSRSAGKHPRIPRWQILASTDEKQIREWWARWPFAHIGIACGNELPGGGYLTVVDIDPRNDGDITLALLEKRYGPLPETPRNITGGHGQHIFFRSRRPVPSRSNSLGPGIDVKCRGGYVLAPPSGHASGTPYQRDVGADIAEVEIASAPDWLLVLADPPRVEAPKQAPDAIIEGGRHDAMLSLAGSMRRRGLSGHEILPTLEAVNAHRCRPPLDDVELKKLAYSATWSPADPISGEDPWRLMSAEQIFAELPPYPWLIKGLHVAPGRITLLNGYANAGKTVVAMTVALGVATGRPIWDIYEPTKTGKVLHLNGEIGTYLARERYQRLARAAGIDSAALVKSGNIVLSNYPTARLDDQNFEAKLALACAGYTLVIIDSLRAFSGSLDENSKEIGVALFVLARVSEATGATIMVLHHNRKTNPEGGGGAKEAISGSGSIFGASECAFVMDQKVKKGPILVQNERSPLGRQLDDFGLLIEDVAHDGDPRWGLRVVHLEAEQMAEMEERIKNAAKLAAAEKSAVVILDVVRQHAGVFRGSQESFRATCGIGKEPFTRGLTALTAAKRLIEGGTYHKPEWRLP